MKALLIIITLLTLLGCGNKQQESLTKGAELNIGSTSASFSRRAEAISRLKGLKASYISVRDGDYLGQTGLIETYRNLNQKTLLWSEGWKNLESFFQEHSSNPEVLEAGALERLSAQQNLLIQTSLSYQRLESLAVRALSKLAQPKAIDFDLGGLQQFYQAFQVSNQRLKRSIEKLHSEGKSHLEKLQEAHTHLTEAMNIRIRQILVTRQINDLEETMDMVKKIFLSERIIAPLEQRVTARFLRYYSFYQEGRFFRLRKELHELRSDCSIIIQQIQSSVASEKYIQDATSRIQSKCSRAEQFYSYMQETEIPELVAESVAKRSQRIGAICRSPSQSAVNCEMYQLLGAAQKEDIVKLTPEKLQSLEQSWDELEGDL